MTARTLWIKSQSENAAATPRSQLNFSAALHVNEVSTFPRASSAESETPRNLLLFVLQSYPTILFHSVHSESLGNQYSSSYEARLRTTQRAVGRFFCL